MDSECKLITECDESDKVENRIIKAIFFFVIFIFLILSFKKSTKYNENKNIYNKKNDYIDNENNNLDTINPEELIKARNNFKQYIYIDTIDDSIIIKYNFFIPKLFSQKKKYPLVVFFGDERMVGKEVTAPLTQSVGGVVWATDTFQKKHKCFVLVPKYNEIIMDDQNDFLNNEYLNVAARLISLIKTKYNIDPKRVYGTGQSMGGMITLYLLANYQNLFAAGLIVDGQWKTEELKGLINSTFTYITSEGDEKAFNGQNDVKLYFTFNMIKYGSISNLDAQEDVNKLDIYVKNIFSLGYRHNFISYAKGTVFSSKSRTKNEHIASFNYGYRIEAVKDWLFSQRKKNYEDMYLSQDGRYIYTNFCEKTNEENLCIECIEGYYLSNDKLSCIKTQNCETGDNKKGLCKQCKEKYYLDMRDRICKSYLHIKEYKFCKTVIRGVCISCEKNYYLDRFNKCSQSPNCFKAKNNKCTECLEGYHFGLDNICTNIEKCIYTDNNNECKECEDGYFYDKFYKACNLSTSHFANCKSNSYYKKEKCGVCKNNYYLSQFDYLCYDNTKEGPFYKCQISNFKGDLCQFCIDGYILGKTDFKCTKIEGCIKSQNENTCLECDDGYCLDNVGKCIINYEDIEDRKMFYYRCKLLEKSEDKCKICENNIIPNKEGICYDDIHCDNKDKNGVCQKCQKENPYGYNSYCLNKFVGCVDSFLKNCIKCDNIFNLDICTECEEGYSIDEEGKCVQLK